MGEEFNYERSTDGRNPYAYRVIGVIPAEPVTKWDLLGDDDREAYDGMPLTDSEGGVLRCSGCDELLPTEGAFARHFVLPDLRYWNLGRCPQGAQQ